MTLNSLPGKMEKWHNIKAKIGEKNVLQSSSIGISCINIILFLKLASSIRSTLYFYFQVYMIESCTHVVALTEWIEVPCNIRREQQQTTLTNFDILIINSQTKYNSFCKHKKNPKLKMIHMIYKNTLNDFCQLSWQASNYIIPLS